MNRHFVGRRPSSKSPIGAMILVVLMTVSSACQTPEEVPDDSAAGSATEGDAGDAEDLLAGAEAAAREAMAPVTEFPGPSEGPSGEAGRSVYLVSCGMASEGCARPIEGAEEAADELGWESTVCDGNFDPSQFETCIERAISAGVDGIYLQAISDEFVADPLQRAREAGIEVVSTESRNQPSPQGVSFEVDADWEGQGTALANYFLWQLGAETHTLLQYERSYKSMTALNDSYAALIEAAGGTVEAFDFSEAELTTEMPARTVAELRSNEAINSLVSFDDGVVILIPSLDESGILENVDLAGWSLIGPSLEAIRTGDQTVSVGPPQAWEGWAAMDTLNRLFAGEEPVEQNIPIRLITSENIGDIPLGDSWEGDVDFRQAFRQIWSAQ